MTAIETKFHGPTNKRGARVSATALATRQRVSIAYEHGANHDDAHKLALKALVDKMGWPRASAWQEGDGSKGSRVFVFVSR